MTIIPFRHLNLQVRHGVSNMLPTLSIYLELDIEMLFEQ